MKARGLALAVAVVGLGVAACEADRTSATAAADDVADDATPGATLTPWEPQASGTTKKPTYGQSCRLFRETLWQQASNGLADDSATLAAPPGENAHLVLEVVDAAGAVLSLDVVLEPTLPVRRAYMAAQGTVSWGAGLGQTGTVIDGTLCFETKLAAGIDTRAEFSVIVDGQDGSPWSMGGDFELPGEHVSEATGVTVSAAGALDVDLR